MKKKKKVCYSCPVFFFFLTNIVSIFKRFYKRNRLTEMARTERVRVVVPGRPLVRPLHVNHRCVSFRWGLSSLLFVFRLLP